MYYYRVPPELDQKPCYQKVYKYKRNGYFLIANELLTTTEAKKMNAPTHLLEVVNIPKTKTYFIFGARFECK